MSLNSMYVSSSSESMFDDISEDTINIDMDLPIDIVEVEPILMKNENRFALYPIKHDNFWKLYKSAQSVTWTTEEIDMTNDLKDWLTLNDGEKHFLLHVLAFFATADSIVNENISANFVNEIQIPEIRCFYHHQSHIEDVHAETYSLLLQTYVHNEDERMYLFNSIRNIEGVKRKAEWALKWIDNDAPFAQRLFGFSCVECIFFCGSFCAIFWMSKRNLLPGLKTSNEMISVDESAHVTFAAEVYKFIKYKLSEDIILDIVKSAVETEKYFISEALNTELIGMNARLMSIYIEYCADILLEMFGYNKHYKVECPFDFMINQGLKVKSNFFEHNVTSYARFGMNTNTKSNDHHILKFDEDF